MVQSIAWGSKVRTELSVLALSSRFDGRRASAPPVVKAGLSVLALSSRFDGQWTIPQSSWQNWDFQYSLCRVVLMVIVCDA